jgi:site-specific recombinase XerD
MSEKPISPLRRRMIEDMTVRNFVEKTQNDYIRHVRTFTTFLGRAPDTAAPEDLRLFQLHQTQAGVGASGINGSVAALRFFFTVTLDRPEMARHLTFVREPRTAVGGGCWAEVQGRAERRLWRRIAGL